MKTTQKKRIENIIKSLEEILKVANNDTQKSKVSNDIKYWQSKLNINDGDTSQDSTSFITREIQKKPSSTDDADKEEDDLTINKAATRQVSLLQDIIIEPISKSSNSSELNKLCSYIRYFYDEYMVALSDYNVKLVFNHSITRDKLLLSFDDINLIIKNYTRRLEQSDRQKDSTILDPFAKNKQTSDINAEYRNLFCKVGFFLNDLQGFVKILLDDYNAKGNSILNPHAIIYEDVNKTHKSVLDGQMVIAGLELLQQFINELIDYFDFKSINNVCSP